MIITRDQVAHHPAGQPYEVPAGALLTSAARECLEARGSRLVPGTGAAPNPNAAKCECGAATCSCASPPPASAAAPPAAEWSSSLARRGVDQELWRPLLEPRRNPSSPSASRTAPQNGTRAALGPRDTHLDGCYLGTGPCEEGDVVVVTAIGKNRPRVLAEIAAQIADLGGDIQEISQRIVDGFFHTILTVDMGRAPGRFAEAKRALEGLTKEGDYRVQVQHEKVFRYMHRI